MGMLGQAIVFLLAAVVMVPIARKLGLGAVLGYLIAGVLIGPWVLALVSDVETILHFSELGVVLLLFVIGLELRPQRLKVLRRLILFDGLAQLTLTTLALWPLAAWWLDSARLGILVAVVLALSSTAIGLQMLAEKKQLAQPYGRSAFGILLLQDIAVIPLLALIPLFAPGGTVGQQGQPVWFSVLQSALVIAAIIFGGRRLLKPILTAIVRARIREIFIAAVLLVALGTAALAEWAGLSMALGAFLAGVLLSESEYRHELEAGIEPFKGLLLGLFFMAVGMSIDFGRVVSGPVLILSIVAVLMSVKFAVLLIVGRLAGLDRASSLSLAFALPQAGEFGFILFSVAIEQNVLATAVTDPLIVAISISMALTPLMYWINERWVQPRLVLGSRESPQLEDIPDDHGEPQVIIAGLGRVGQIVARNLSMLDIHFTALDFDHDQVAFVRRFGHKVFYGNATNPDVLRAAGADHATLFVLTISDIEISIETARMLKRHFPNLRIHARARNRQHALELKALGVDYVIREAWLSSLDMARETLRALGVKNPARYVDLFRQHDEQVLDEQVQHKDDEEALRELDHRSREQLAELFEEDHALLHEASEKDAAASD
ncbi:MAG: monovalent cation:proton antiporter-2 (CPA2) family protein [Wenzhouxiangellaceae bacterium]|nr:monovalent cation:proton antiporter-2 (CPA2) family protein [Wenzhouxiangellaceae bacterium]